MTTFLQNVLKSIDLRHISDYTFILPSKRAGLFFKKELIKHLDKTIISPKILSIEEFIEHVSELTPINNTEVLFQFYSIYLQITPKESQEPFDIFCKWAQILIQDFNEIDRYDINGHDIFNYLSSVKEIEHWSVQDEQTDLVSNYLVFWKHITTYYNTLKEQLLHQNLGYQGLVYRMAKNNIETYKDKTDKVHVFLGFNALNRCEEIIFKSFKNSKKGIIIWDLDQYFFNNKHHAAGTFLRQLNKANLMDNETINNLENTYTNPKNIKLIGTQKSVAQSKVVANILNVIGENEKNNFGKNLKDIYANTALVLSDENLLLPVLNSLPRQVEYCNITMGLPLKLAPLSNLFELFFLLNRKHSTNIYFKDVLSILTNNYVEPIFKKNNVSLQIQRLNKENKVNFTPLELETLFPSETEIIAMLFSKWSTVTEGLRTLKNIVKEIKLPLKESGNKQLDLEYLYKFDSIFTQLETLNKRYKHIENTETLFQLYKELLTKESLDIAGEPFEGLQIMGMLESRVLDFETVIITSVNEGILPAGKSNNSFIPFDLKIEYGLPTYNDKDAIYTYHFYHLLQRAKNVYIIYNTEIDAINGGEKSRFIQQLETENIHKIKHQIVSADIPTYLNRLEVVPKTETVHHKIMQLGQKGFSPSSLTNYMRNPLDFYYDKILGVKANHKVEETVAANTLGTIVHETLEELYTPLIGQLISIKEVHTLKKHIHKTVLKHFEIVYKNGDVSTGKNLIIFEVAKRYVLNFLNHEITQLAAGNTIKIIALEDHEEVLMSIDGINQTIKIKGMVDRVDEFNGQTRIIDYKTGKVSQDKVRVSSWDLILTDFDKYSKPFQILAYAYMRYKSGKSQLPLKAGIISFKNLTKGFLPFQKKVSHGKYSEEITMDILVAFESQLKQLILEIYNKDIPFTEKEIKALSF